MRRITALSIAAICLLAAAPRPAGATGAEDAAGIVASINTLRSSRGLRPFDVHPELELKAQAWASHMSASGTLAHSALTDGITAAWLSLGENVAMGSTVDHAQETLVASPSHFANMVDPEYTHIGVGVVSAGGRVYVAQEFMQLSTAATSTPPSAAPASDPPPTPAPVTPKPAAPAPAPRPAAPAPAAPAPAPAPPPQVPAPRPAPVPPAASAQPAATAAAPEPVLESTPPTTLPAVTTPPELPEPPNTPVTHLGLPEGPDGAGGSRAAGVGLAIGMLLLVAGALLDWARPRRG